MKLYAVATSPYVRKVLVLAHETGLAGRIEIVPADISFTKTDAGLNQVNPIGKVPALALDGGGSLYDSPVICEYLDSLHDGPSLFPASGPARWHALQRQALGDGILDAAVAARLEVAARPAEFQWDGFVALQMGKVRRGLAALEADCRDFPDLFDIGGIAIACALSYIDLRYDGEKWRDGHPALAAWFQPIAARPSLVATVPPS
jgi:glutathione S-transferase